MKKVTIILAVFSLVSIHSVRADIRLGVKAGVNLAKASFNKDVIETSNLTGLQVGPVLELSIPVIGIGLDAAVLYSQQGLKLKLEGKDFEKKENTLDIPVNLKLKVGLIGVKGYLSAGPYASFNLSGTDLFKIPDNVSEQFENESFGAGINAGIGIELLGHLQVGVNYKIGLTNDYKSFGVSDVLLGNGKTRVWSLAAVYFF
jgi:hypothetical protein